MVKTLRVDTSRPYDIKIGRSEERRVGKEWRL